NRHEMLEMEPLNCLLEDKWKKYGARMFFLNFLVYLVYLVIFTVVAYNKKDVKGILFLASTALYLGRRQEYLGFLVMCLALSWVNVLYYSRGDRHMGIYSVMIQKLFKFTIGMGDMEFTQDYQYMEVFYVLLIAYIILTYILLLNMLIALMNRTVEKITMESTSIWRLQRAVTILDMEKRLPYCLKKTFRSGVEKKLGTALGEDQRRCFRVERVNWNKWNTDLVNISEDPGCFDRSQLPDLDSPLRRLNRG
ncbi:hypothetical protein XENOCAPTIV_027296, partial [Xenoophorus captivus]